MFGWTKPGSITRHFDIPAIAGAIAGMPNPATIGEAQVALDAINSQYEGLAGRLFAVSDGRVVEDTLTKACRAGEVAGPQLVWSALVMGDERISDAVENFLTDENGRLDRSRFSSPELQRYLDGRGIGSPDKVASNILRWIEIAGIVEPTRHGSTIVGISSELPTAHTAPALAQLVVDRFHSHDLHPTGAGEPVELALAMGVNAWLNLSREEFREACQPPPAAVTPATRPTIYPDVAELDHELRRKGQVILQGPPGTGKTFLARRYAEWFTAGRRDITRLSEVRQSLPANSRSARSVAERLVAMGAAGAWEIVQFHQSLTYDDFVRSMSATAVPGGVTFEPADRTFGFICAVGTELHRIGAEVELLLIIDEINRADISKVFGELIYGLEYRGEPVTTALAVEGDPRLSVPTKLFVIGTMNTADRSIALIDYALRRRFVYLDVRPNRSIVASAAYATEALKQITLTLYDRTAQLFAGDAERAALQVGHSYFLPSAHDEAGQFDEIKRRFTYEVLPLLIEYDTEGRFAAGALAATLESLGLGDCLSSGAIDQVAAMNSLDVAMKTWTTPETAAVTTGVPGTSSDGGAHAEEDLQPADPDDGAAAPPTSSSPPTPPLSSDTSGAEAPPATSGSDIETEPPNGGSPSDTP